MTNLIALFVLFIVCLIALCDKDIQRDGFYTGFIGIVMIIDICAWFCTLILLLI